MGKRSRQHTTGLNEDERIADSQRRLAEQKELERKKQARIAKAFLENIILGGKTQ